MVPLCVTLCDGVQGGMLPDCTAQATLLPLLTYTVKGIWRSAAVLACTLIGRSDVSLVPAESVKYTSSLSTTSTVKGNKAVRPCASVA